MSVHTAAVAIEQDRADVTTGDGTVDSSSHCWRHRNEDDLVACADDPHDAVSVFFAEVADVQAGGLKDPECEQTQQTYQREVVGVGGVACRGQHRLELQVRQSQSGDWGETVGLGHSRQAHARGPVDDAGPVETHDDG